MNLTTEQGRKEAIEAIEQSFIQSLREIGVEMSEDAVVNVGQFTIVIGIKATPEYEKYGLKMQFASEVDLYAEQNTEFKKRPNQINFVSSGSFDNTVRESYWRTIHAASILKNWDKVCEQVNNHCKRYSELVDEIQKQNS